MDIRGVVGPFFPSIQTISAAQDPVLLLAFESTQMVGVTRPLLCILLFNCYYFPRSLPCS